MGMQPCFRTASARSMARTTPDGRRVFRMRAITSEIARDGAIILADAVRELLPVFMVNPAVLSNHPWLSEDERPEIRDLLGHVIEDGVTIVSDTDDGGGYVDAEFVLAEDANPDAKMAGDLIESGDLRAVSVGWLDRGSVTAKSPRAEIEALPRFAREALLSGACTRVYTRIEWFEVSLISGAGSDRNALIQLRALWAARNKKEDEPMPAPPAEKTSRGNAGGVANARTGHPGTNDAMARLRGAYESLSSGYCYCYGPCTCGIDNDEPPEADVCKAVATILREIADQVEALSAVPDIDALPAASAAAAPTDGAKAREGKTLSADSRAKIQEALDAQKEGSKAHKRCAHALEEMLAIADSDAYNDDASSLPTDEEGAADRALKAALDNLK